MFNETLQNISIQCRSGPYIEFRAFASVTGSCLSMPLKVRQGERLQWIIKFSQGGCIYLQKLASTLGTDPLKMITADQQPSLQPQCRHQTFHTKVTPHSCQLLLTTSGAMVSNVPLLRQGRSKAGTK